MKKKIKIAVVDRKASINFSNFNEHYIGLLNHFK